MSASQVRTTSPRVVVIGAGIGGLTTAGVLARAGLDVTVLEAHVYAGGCAGTFYHKGYRFDAGATLAGGFYPGGPMDQVARAVGVSDWSAAPSDATMSVQLPSGVEITRWADAARRHATYRDHFGADGMAFWQWQERTADSLWDLALSGIPWLPQSPRESLRLLRNGMAWLGRNFVHLRPGMVADAFGPVAQHLHGAPTALRLFVDAQLLIAAQSTSSRVNALYGASALDLPRRGVVHFPGGMAAIADTLVDAIRQQGGRVRFRRAATQIVLDDGAPVAVETKQGERFPADLVIANLSPWDVAALLPATRPPALRELPDRPHDGWGAFMVYAGVDDAAIDPHMPLHRQVIVREPLGEGNTVFVSVSPAWDTARAPAGRRAVTISTHTGLQPWWKLRNGDRSRYEQRKQVYTDRILSAAERVIPGIREASDLILPGTPVTFQRFTRRQLGWVGGFPQTNLLRTWSPQLGPGLWMVGDSIFPGQSTAAVALGGLRVAHAVLDQYGHAVAGRQNLDQVILDPGSAG